MLSILTLGLLARACQATDFWPWHALNISWDNNPFQTFAMLPSLTKTSLLIAADAFDSGSWPMWTSSAAHADFLYMDGTLFAGSSWDDTVSWPLNLTNDVQWIHERAIVWDVNNNSNSLNNQATTLTHNLTVNSPGGQLYTMNVGYFSLYGAGTNFTWLNSTGFNNTQDLQLATAKQNSIISSLSYGLQIGSPSLDIEPSLVMGGYDRSRCLTEPITTKDTTFQLTDISVGANGSGWPFTTPYTANSNASANSQSGLLGGSLEVLANPGVPYLHLPRATCDAIAKYLPVTYDQSLGLYLWNTQSDARHFDEITQTFAYLTFTFSDDSEINVPFSLLNLELDTPLTASKTRYFPCRPFTPHKSQPYHLGRAFLQAALLVQNWETNTTWLSQAPGPDMTIPSTPVIIEETDTTIAQMPYAPAWLSTWNGTLRESNWTNGQGSNSTGPYTKSWSSDSSLSGGTIAGIVIGAVAGVAIIVAAMFFIIRRRRAKAGYGDVALISFDSDKSAHHEVPKHEHKEDALSSPTYEADSAHVNELASNEADKIGELPLSMAKVERAEVDGTGIAELPGHDAQSR
ncbi:uncharacterized protein M437DRAFT_72032 [Aureobasidium melanogenum CBS 110374]|uniref:Peptidase A1 domain-containing protein n=1 Tax=Aureobasidium melanogenum (strain CBS 110374) TaxID=1043003 RepID=A0A074W034_AURM1|nr:uncharacterized protein M437DRAFT_72032 [Aureobasidium melanogenum CBS 110374]KEQ66440.1 hypothetical protein M437DRAFT_72032 [Aureobasidium melanogenum CBS 110374]